MFKKILSLVIVMSVFTTSAFAVSNEGLKIAFEDLHMAIAVEGVSQEVAQQEFAAKVEALGVSNEELLSFAKSQIKSESVKRDLELATKMHPADAQEYAMNALSKSQSTGASWNGVVLSPLGFVLLVIIIVVIAKSNQRADCHTTGC